jgi:hypothetical protein
VDTEELFEHFNIKVGSELCDAEYRAITVRPEWNFILLNGKDRTLIAYDMDRKKVSEWGEGSIVLRSKSRSVFLNGFMHMLEYSVIVAMDMEEMIWRTIHKPGSAEMSIHQAQGHLCVCCADFHNRS